MISCPSITKRQIRGHYDLATLFYRLMWGPHIHHGLWHADESPELAQRQLIEALADVARVSRGDRLLDIGCGMGGSTIHLAKTRGVDATGVTLSAVQRHWAAASSRLSGASQKTRFLRLDAESAEFAPSSFDVVWSVECTEHLFDKPAFFRRAAGWLRPGGRLAVCAWLAGNEPATDEAVRQVYEVCEGFLCPSLGTMADYRGWFESAGLVVERADDWTPKVVETWEICKRRVERTRVRWLARAIDRDMTLFIDRFDAILRAYRSGAMSYGCLVAHKPEAADR